MAADSFGGLSPEWRRLTRASPLRDRLWAFATVEHPTPTSAAARTAASLPTSCRSRGSRPLAKPLAIRPSVTASDNRKRPVSRAFLKRMKGLEPSTFCMATRPLAWILTRLPHG
jgi:hypothetical protein